MKKNRRFFSLFAAILMIVSLLAPAAAFAQPAASDSKLSNSLVEQFENEDKVKFVVQLAETADTAAAAANADVAGLSSADAEVVKREAVINAAQATAEATQADVLSYLEANAEDVHSFFITNVVIATATQDVAEEVAAFSEVAKVVPSPEVTLIAPVSFGTEISQELPDVGWNVDRVQAPEAWEDGFDGEGIVIGNLDTGVEWTHPELIDSYRGGEGDHEAHFYDAVNGEEEAYDDNFHGTHVGGTMTGENVGVAPNAQWIAAKGLDADGGGTLDGLLDAAEWFLEPAGDAANAPDVVNNSWGIAGAHPDEVDEWFRDMIGTWHDAGIFSVFAAGNSYTGFEDEDGSVEIPGLYPETLAVGATDVDDLITDFSSRGPSPYGDLKPEVSAPGDLIPSAIPGGELGYASGTSMAAPAVAGLAAIALQANADIGIEDLQDAFMASATPLTDEVYEESPNNAYGHGLVNAVALVEAVQEDDEEDPEPEPEPEPIDRIAGETRYDTAIEISQDGWEDGALEGETVVLARGDDFADALAGVPLAHALNSPILLIHPDAIERIDNIVLEEIERLGAESAVILGGEEAVSDESENSLNNAGLDVTRLAGDARFDTAVEIARALEVLTGESSEVVIANGMDFPDALAVGSYAAQAESPILLTLADRLPEATEAALEEFDFASSLVVGGELVVSEEVSAELPEVNRLAGDDRYGTNREILTHTGVTDGSELYVATGRDYADALTGAVLAAQNETAIVLVHERIPAELEEFFAENELDFHAIFGGDKAVIDDVKEQLEEIASN